MIDENRFLCYAFLLGIFITFVYDLLRILRRVLPHGKFWVSAEDFVFWIFCGVEVFLLMQRESNGTLRWFAVLGAFAGMILYKKTLSGFLVKRVSCLLKKLLAMITKIGAFLFRPAVLLKKSG